MPGPIKYILTIRRNCYISDISVIKQLLNHKTISSTQTYIHEHYIRNIGIKIKENQEIYKYINSKTYYHSIRLWWQKDED